VALLRGKAGRDQDGARTPPAVPAEAVQTELDKILASANFVNSERLNRFLRFVTEQTFQGNSDKLKEYRLGVEVFDRPEGYDPRTDPIVRVEARRLRSKLQSYYENEGREDRVVIDIPKGSYAPAFQHRAAAEGGRRGWIARGPRTIALAAGLLAAMIAFVFVLAENRRLRGALDQARLPAIDSETAAFWGDFLAPGAENFVVFGSPVFLVSQRERTYFRTPAVSDPTNLDASPAFQSLQKHFGPLLGPLSGPRFDYALMGDAIAVQRLTAFFGSIGRRLTAIPAHLVNWDTIRDGNIIFLGAPRMNPPLRALPIQRDFDWEEGDEVIRNRSPQSGEQSAYTTRDHREAMTYAVIGSYPGLRPNREVLLLLAHSEPGVRAAVDRVTRPDQIRSMTSRLGIVPGGERKRYEMLLRVMVDKGVPVKIEYLTHHLVSGTGANR